MAMVGELGKGFAAALYGVSLGRIYNSARSVGYGRWALEMAIDYSSTREAFGSADCDYQGVSFPIAESATELHAAHLMGLNVFFARPGTNGGQRTIDDKSILRAEGIEGVDCAMQTHGAMGFTNELGLAEAWHSLRIVNVADGTNEILNKTIAQRLCKGDLEL